jgi:thioredoxin 1
MKTAIRYTASWCLPCKTYSKYWDKAVAERKDWEFIVIDVDTDSESANKHNIMSLPTTVLMLDDRVVAKHTGVMMEKEINEKLDHWS